MGTHFKGSLDQRLALDTYIKLMRAADSVSARLERSLKRRGLTMTQFGVLEVLYHLGPMCQRALGRKLLKSGGNVTTVVGNLERAALVRRTRSSTDRRFVTVALTDAGRERVASMFPEHVRLIQIEMSSLGAQELEQLGSMCRSLGTGARSQENTLIADQPEAGEAPA